jgi:hypothetical protein
MPRNPQAGLTPEERRIKARKAAWSRWSRYRLEQLANSHAELAKYTALMAATKQHQEQ